VQQTLLLHDEQLKILHLTQRQWEQMEGGWVSGRKAFEPTSSCQRALASRSIALPEDASVPSVPAQP